MKIELQSFYTLLTVLFIGLKLGHVISWSWWLVTAPLWIPLLIALLGLFIFFVGIGLSRD